MNNIKYKDVNLYNAMQALSQNNKALSTEEKKEFAAGRLELIPASIVLKTMIADAENQKLITSQKNKDFRQGICDFQDGRLLQHGLGGSFVSTGIRASWSTHATVTDPAQLSFHYTSWPFDMCHAEIAFTRGSDPLRNVRLSNFIFKGDSPQDLTSTILDLKAPLVISKDFGLGIELIRPDGVTPAAGNQFLSIEFIGYRLLPVISTSAG
ncbi:MAG: hypothetical protein ACI8ZM_002476 [Crocinitomix sp.]|jgi:hypothetical protein